MRALTALLIAGTASAQGFDYTRQDVKVDLTGASPVIDLDLTVAATEDGVTTFDFLIPPADVLAFDVEGASVTVTAHPQYAQYLKQVTLPTALATGQTAHLHARLGGAMRCTAPSGPPVCFTGTDRTLLLPADYDAAWYFVNPYEDTDPFVGDITVRAPGAQTVLAGTGPGTVVDLGDGTKQWKYSLPIPVDLQFLAAGDFESVEAPGEYTVRAYYPRGAGNVAREQQIADMGAKVLPIYGRLLGHLPAREAHFITVPANFPAAGMGMLGNVFIAEYVFSDVYNYLIDQGAAHELAHSWWGNLSSGAGEEKAFMAEAFAEYTAWRAMGEVRGDVARTSGMRMNAVWYMYRTPAGGDVAPLSVGVTRNPSYVYVTYHKGPVVLRALEEVAGVEAFTAGLKALVAMGPGGSSMAKLVEAVQTAGGADLSGEVAQWLQHAGYPKAVVTPKLEGGALALAVQSDGAFSYRLPVRVRLSGGRVVEQVLQVTSGASMHTVPVDGDVETIELDPRWTLPREVKPAAAADVTFDGVVDGRDLLEVAVRHGGKLPTQRRVDGAYDPLFDVDADRQIDDADLTAVLSQVR